MMRTRYSRAAWSSSVPTAAPGGNERGWAGAMAGEASDEEAAWRDLIAQYSAPAADDAAPWPVREDLSGRRQAPPRTPGTPGSSRAPGSPGPPGEPGSSRAPGSPGPPGERPGSGAGEEDPDTAQ